MLTIDEIGLLDRLYQTYQKKLIEISEITTKEEENYQKLEHSFLLNEYESVKYNTSFRVNGCPEITHLIIVKVLYKIRSGKYNLGNEELQIIGIKQLPQDFGNILIRPETLADKIVEFLHHTEIDFINYPDFSSKYYVLSNEISLCQEFATENRIQLIEKQRDIFIQVKGDVVIAKFFRGLTEDDFAGMIDFLIHF